MTPRAKKRLMLALAIMTTPGVAFLFLYMLDVAREHANQSRCVNNLKQIVLAMDLEDQVRESYPQSLQALTNLCPDPRVFVCPQTGHKPGALSNIHAWTDYVWVPPKPHDVMKEQLPIVYCVPEHHHNRYGVAAFTDGSVRFIRPGDFWVMVNSPQGGSNTNSPATPQPLPNSQTH